MSETRSPRYPNVALGEAISRARAIYEKEHMSPLTPNVAAEAMGYGSLNGTSLKMISSLKKYGLLEGRGNDVRLTKDAQVLIIDSPNDVDYQAAMRRCALNPEIFIEIERQFQKSGSERNISVYLEKQGYKPDAASLVARNFKETMALVGDRPDGYSDSRDEKASTVGVAALNEAHSRAVAVTTTRMAPRQFYGGGSFDDAEVVGASGAPFRITQNGKQLHIVAWVDLKSLQILKEVLKSYEFNAETAGSD